jgi:hypothetical protein
MINEESFIPGIHNYCDRWCERCGFTARCRVFAMEAEITDDEQDIGSDAFVRNLSNILNDAKSMLEEKAAEFGIDLTSIDHDEIDAIRERQRSAVEGSELACLAEKYAFDIRPVLAAQEEWLAGSELEEEMIQEVLAVLYWYQFFIAAKVQRGLHGIIDDDGEEDTEELEDAQSDANGSIKVALIAIERSILAWTYLLDANNANVIRPFIEMLESLKQMAEARFPHARDFIRPGFDEIEIVM